ncbi:MAG: tetratricopeptide repeat protein [Candidatus Moranbacteria bacterium]|nr:tetratricopeptide repeat protein [Candidatus Moranbacteria bacterium]
MEEGKNPFQTRPNASGVQGSGNGAFQMPRPAAPEQRPVNPATPKQSVPRSGLTSKFFDLLISISLTALFVGLPIFFTGMTFQGIAFEKQLYFYFWILVGLVSWVSKGVLLGEMRIRRTPLDIPILLFVAVYGASAVFSVDRWHSFWGSFGDPSRGFLSIAALALSYYLIISHFTPKRFYLMFGGLVVSSLLVILWSFLAVMGIRFLPASVEAYAPLSLIGTVSTLAIFLSIVPPIFLTAIFALFREQGKKTWPQYAIMAGLFIGLLLDLFLLLALSSFVSWAVVLGGLGFFLIFILAQIVRPPEQWVWAPMLVFVVLLSFLMIGDVRVSKSNLPVEVLPKLSFAWDIATDAVTKGSFFLGAGPSNYGYVFSLYRPVEYNQNALYTLRFDQAPGLFLEALPTIGVLGTVLFLVLAFSFLSLGIYLLSSDKEKNKIYSIGFWSVSVMFFIASFMSAFNGAVLVMGSLIAALSLAVVLWESGSEERYLALSLKASPKFALALAFVFMVVSAGVAFLFAFIGKAFFADISAGKVLREQVPTEQSIKNLDRAASLYSQESQYYARIGQTYMAIANQEAAKPKGEADPNKVVFAVREAIARTERGVAISPMSVRMTEALGLIYENSSLYAADALPKAFEAYEKALALEPNNPLLLVKLGQIKRAQADQKPESEAEAKAALFTEAKEYFEQAVEKKSNLPVAHYSLSVVLSRLKDYDKAIESASAAIRLDPQNATYRYSIGALYQSRRQDGDFDKAEAAYKDILEANEKLVDVRLALGLLYEEKKDKDAAIAEYRKTVESIPEGEENDALRKQVEVFIDVLQSGGSNVEKQSAAPKLPEAPAPAPAPAVPASPAPTPAPAPAQTPIPATEPATNPAP